jgi:hypothetical protein
MPTEKKRPKREKKVFFIVKYGTFEEHGFLLLLLPFFRGKDNLREVPLDKSSKRNQSSETLEQKHETVG